MPSGQPSAQSPCHERRQRTRCVDNTAGRAGLVFGRMHARRGKANGGRMQLIVVNCLQPEDQQ